MSDEWGKFYQRLIAANLINDFIVLMNSEAMRHAKSASQVGAPEDVRRDALADVRFCLSRADYATKALMEAREKANSRSSGGFLEGGAVTV